MTAEEGELFRSQLVGKKLYLEFGCGGSTLTAARAGIPRIVSVESDDEWISKLRKNPALSKSSVTFHHADVGPTGAWGKPVGKEHAAKWQNYWQQVWSLIPGTTPDAVLVDGRWRVACALQVVLRCPESTLLMVHDFWKRGHYHCLLNYTDHVASAGSLAVLKPRKDVDYRSLALDLSTHFMDSR